MWLCKDVQCSTFFSAPPFHPILFELKIEVRDRIDMLPASIRPALFTPSCKFIDVDYGFEVKFISDDDRRSGLHDL